MKITRYVSIFLLPLATSVLLAQDAPLIHNSTPFSIGETLSFESVILSETRLLNIYLPLSYASDSTLTYPVIYLLDGSADEDFVHIAGLVQFGSFSWINMIPETIVVGISNVDRQRDFTFPSRIEQDREDAPTSGGSAGFINFIAEEVQPLIGSQYRTGKIRTVIGQSLGGLLATEILLKEPDLFDNYIIVSPSLWWDDESLLAETAEVSDSPQAVYIGVGKEGEVMERVARSLYDKLSRKKSETDTFHFRYFDQLDHGDALHLAVYDAFEKIFRKDEM